MKKRLEPFPPTGEGVEFMPFSLPDTRVASMTTHPMVMPCMDYGMLPNMMQ